MKRCEEKSKFPPVWTVSKVKTIFKSGETLERGNYRPNSLLGIPSKVLEAIIIESFDKHYMGSAIASSNQWAYKQGWSTELLLLHLTETLRHALDSRKIIGL